ARGGGLGGSAAGPVFALPPDARRNPVMVGPRESLATTRVAASGALSAEAERVRAKLRYRSAPISARVAAHEGGFTLELDEPAYGVAPGQAAVLYESGVVVGAGLVTT